MITIQLSLPNDVAEAVGRQLQLHEEAAADILASEVRLKPEEESDLSLMLVFTGRVLGQLREHAALLRIRDEDEIRERGKKLFLLKRSRMKARGEPFNPEA